MYEWSKNITKKISESNCLNSSELAIVEIALRMYDIWEMMTLDAIFPKENNTYELEYQADC